MLNPVPRKNETIVAMFEYPIKRTTLLAREGFNDPTQILECFLKRSSSLGLQFVDINSLGQVLWYAAKVARISVQEDGYILSSRRSPSAGGRHPIDIIVSQPIQGQVEARTFSYYNPFEHSLNLLELDIEICSAFLKHIDGILPTCNSSVTWFVAHPERTSAKYDNFESLIWRDAGALIYCFQLVCTALGLKSCPLGSLGEPFISELFKKNGKVFGVGGLLISK